MQYDFLKSFPKRMKNVGLYTILVRSIISKTSWNEYGFIEDDERINLVFSVLLFIMEKSLIEESCTIDDIASFIDDINNLHYRKSLNYEECITLSEFIVNTILSNEGKQMSFEGYDYSEGMYHSIYIRYVRNKIVYTEHDIRRTSYMLTDDGYNLLLSTLEVEKNLQIPIQEMIFKMHLEKQSYDKAVENIRTIFQSIRMQYQKIMEAMYRIRRNALEYSVEEYRQTLEENLSTIQETKDKFQNYKELVKERIKEYEEREIQLSSLSPEDADRLKNLKIISYCLGMVIEEHQSILSKHMDLKQLYTKELEELSQVALIKRFSLRSEVYEKILEKPEAIGNLNLLLSPLISADISKIYNPKIALKPHKVIRKKAEEELTENIDFDEEAWEAEQERIRLEKRKVYETSLEFILQNVLDETTVTLSSMKKTVNEDADSKSKLIPDIEVFKEIMVELIKAQSIDIDAIKAERKNVLDDGNEIFELNFMLLEILEKIDKESRVKYLYIEKLPGANMVVFENVVDADGNYRNIRCSDTRISVGEK